MRRTSLQTLCLEVRPSILGFSENSFTQDTAPPILKELSRLLDPSLNIMDESKLLDHWTQYTNIIERIFDS